MQLEVWWTKFVFTMHQDETTFEKEKGNNDYELFCILDGFYDLIAGDDQPDKDEQWCCNLIVDKIVEYYKLCFNEGVVLYKEGDIGNSDGKGDDAMMC